MSKNKLEAREAEYRERVKELFDVVADFEPGSFMDLAKLLTQLRMSIWGAGLGNRLQQMESEVIGRYESPSEFAVIHLTQTADVSVERLAECLKEDCTRCVKPKGGWPNKPTKRPLKQEIDVEYLEAMQVHWLRMGRELIGDERQRYGPDPKRQGIVYWEFAPLKVTRTTWLFLCAVWGKYSVPFCDIGEAVWGDDATKASTIRSRAFEATRELHGHRIDRQFSCEGEKVSPLCGWPE